MKHIMRRFFQKIGIFIIRSFVQYNRERLTSTQLEASIIFRKLILNNDTDMLISPISGKYYLKNVNKNILIVMSASNISIINHIFGYDVSIPSHLHDKLKEIFEEEVENRRCDMEEEYRKNVRHSLKQVLKGLKDEK